MKIFSYIKKMEVLKDKTYLKKEAHRTYRYDKTKIQAWWHKSVLPATDEAKAS